MVSYQTAPKDYNTTHTEHKGEKSRSICMFLTIWNISNVNSKSSQIHTTAKNSNFAMPFPINGIIDLLIQNEEL